MFIPVAEFTPLSVPSDELRFAFDYPEQPWFDGGEARGFQMYHVPWLQEPRESYGCTLILPKWFEVHK